MSWVTTASRLAMWIDEDTLETRFNGTVVDDVDINSVACFNAGLMIRCDEFVLAGRSSTLRRLVEIGVDGVGVDGVGAYEIGACGFGTRMVVNGVGACGFGAYEIGAYGIGAYGIGAYGFGDANVNV